MNPNQYQAPIASRSQSFKTLEYSQRTLRAFGLAFVSFWRSVTLASCRP